jgi:hypothetical protein
VPTPIRHQANSEKPCLETIVEQVLHHETPAMKAVMKPTDDDGVVHRQHVAVLVEIEREGAGHGRHGEKERELRRRALVGAHQQRAGDGRTRSRRAGNHRQALAQPDLEGSESG